MLIYVIHCYCFIDLSFKRHCFFINFLLGIVLKKVLKKKNYGPFLWMGFNCLKATVTSRRQFTFYHSVPRNSWYSFYRPWIDERLSRPWSHQVVLNTGLLDWESSALTTRRIKAYKISFCFYYSGVPNMVLLWEINMMTYDDVLYLFHCIYNNYETYCNLI